MTHLFEIYISSQKTTKDSWEKLHQSLGQYLGFLGDYEIVVVTKDGTVRCFLRTRKDVSSLGSGINGMILRKLNDPHELVLPHTPARLPLFNL